MNATRKSRQIGTAAVELALSLPVLLTVLFGVIDLSRSIQYDNIITHMSREGANLASRAKEVTPPQIINALGSTAAPLQMNVDGMIYISQITGVASGEGEITQQFRAAQGKQSLQSRLWVCPSWNADQSCTVPGVKPRVTLPTALRVGETIWAVEARYDYSLLTRYLFRSNPDLYAVTVL